MLENFSILYGLIHDMFSLLRLGQKNRHLRINKPNGYHIKSVTLKVLNLIFFLHGMWGLFHFYTIHAASKINLVLRATLFQDYLDLLNSSTKFKEYYAIYIKKKLH